LEGASSLHSGRRPAQRRADTRPVQHRRPDPAEGYRPHAVPGARLSAVRKQAQASVPSSFVPSVPSGPRPFRSGDQATHGRFGVRLHDPLRLRTRGFGSKLPRLCALSPPDATRHKARLCRIADPAGRNRCPRSRATSRTVDAGGEPPLSLAWPSELGHHKGVLPRKHSAGWQGLQRRAGAAGASSHCRWHCPPCLAATRAAAPEGALPVARCRILCRGRWSKLLQPAASGVRARRPRGPLRSEAPCRWPGASATCLWPRRRTSAAFDTGRRAQQPEGCRARKHLAGRRSASSQRFRRRRQASAALCTGRPELAATRAAAPGSTLPGWVPQSAPPAAKANLRNFRRWLPELGDHEGCRTRKHPAGGPAQRPRASSAGASSCGADAGSSGLGGHEGCRARKRPTGWQSVPAARRRPSKRTPKASGASFRSWRPRGPPCSKAPCR
jgi:hypothetical protein